MVVDRNAAFIALDTCILKADIIDIGAPACGGAARFRRIMCQKARLRLDQTPFDAL